MKIEITREDMVNQFKGWGLNIIEELEEKKGGKLTAEECKKILLYCLGFVGYKEELEPVIDLSDLV